MTDDILDIVKFAKLFAKDKHVGQFRNDDITPYWHHLRQVVHNLQVMGITEESILCAGWLHDTIEDTDTSFDSIQDSFGFEIAILRAFLATLPKSCCFLSVSSFRSIFLHSQQRY